MDPVPPPVPAPTPAAPPIHATATPSRTELNLRTPKACEECRRRKVKCDGTLPRCRPCTERSLTCTYREKTRVRRKKNASSRPSSSLNASAHNSGDESVDDVVGKQEPVAEQVYSSVSATQKASPEYSTELYYGPSSSFSFLQQIHRRLNALTSHGKTSGDAHLRVEKGEEGLDRFKYRGLFFGRHSAGDSRGRDGMHISDVNNPNHDVLFLPVEKAREFLRNYLQTNYHMLPLFPPEEYERLLEQTYTLCGSKSIEKSLVLVALAIGATCTCEMAGVAENLFERAKKGVQHLDEIVNVRSVQISLLMYQLVVGRPNAAYLLTGSAVRKAFAAGLHKESAISCGSALNSVEERRRTFWNLYMVESTICYIFGRPLDLACEMTQVPLPQDQPLLMALAQLCRIQARSAKEIYVGPDRSLAKLWQSAMSIKAQLEDLLRSVDPRLADAFRMRTHAGSVGIQQMVFFSLFQHTVLLTFRPFMLFRTMICSARPPDASELAAEKVRWLKEGCKICIDTARTFISTFDFAMAANPLVRLLRLSGFFLETQAFVLVYASLLGDPEVFAENMPYLHKAMKCFAELERGFPLKTISYALSQMVQLLQQIGPGASAGGGDEAHATSTPVSVATDSEAISAAAEPVEWMMGIDQQLQADYDDVERLNLDFGFDMTAMDFEQFLNRDGLGVQGFMQ